MELETQIAKIQIGNFRQTNAYVYAACEQAFNPGAEVYILVELPLFNPQALDDCEHIAQAMHASLKRSYRKQITESTFENALAQINEELGKLASLGKTNWIGKINALVAVKSGNEFSIAATGKVTALLLRDGQFTNMSDTTVATHPLKTFENFGVGKLRLEDIILLSNTQLFNHLSIDRIKNILRDYTLPLAAQQIISLLEDNAGPDVAFATIIAQQVEPGTTPDEQINLEEFNAPLVKKRALFPKILSAIKSGSSTILPAGKQLFQSAKNKLKDKKTPDFKSLVPKSTQALGALKDVAGRAVSLENFKSYSGQKKFFFISIIILLLALLINIFATTHYKKKKIETQTITSTVTVLQDQVDKASAAYLLHDEDKARTLIKDAEGQIEALKSVPAAEQTQFTALKKQASDLIDKIEKRTNLQATAIANLSNADRLIALPRFIGTYTNGTIVSFNVTTNAVEDNKLRSSTPILYSALYKNSIAVIYDGKSLQLWDTESGNTSKAFADQVPTKDNAAGFSYYTVNNRVYLIDKPHSKVMSYLVSDKGFSKPIVSIQNLNLSGSSDLTVDGNVYIYNNGTITKYGSGKLVIFNQPNLLTPLGNSGRITTSVDNKNVYILDKSNNRIVVVDKKGDLVQTILSPQFTNIKDFIVDEKNKILLVLNDTTLLKLNF